MIGIYDENDYIKTAAQKKKLLLTFWISLGVLLALNVAAFIVYVFQEYDTPYRTPLILFNILSCAVYIVIMYPVMMIKYKRVKDYLKMLYYFKNGLTTEGTNAFYGVDSSVVVKDGVEFINLVFLQWSEKKQEYFERNVLFDVEKPLPALKKGDMVHHVTQGNILVAYELRGDSDDIFD